MGATVLLALATRDGLGVGSRKWQSMLTRGASEGLSEGHQKAFHMALVRL